MGTLIFLLFFATKNYLYWRDWAEKRVYCRVYMCNLICTVGRSKVSLSESKRVTTSNVHVQEIWQRRWRHHINVHAYERWATRLGWERNAMRMRVRKAAERRCRSSSLLLFFFFFYFYDENWRNLSTEILKKIFNK